MKQGEIIMDEMFNMFQDIIDTSEKYIPIEKRIEWISNMMSIAKIHKINIETLLKIKIEE